MVQKKKIFLDIFTYVLLGLCILCLEINDIKDKEKKVKRKERK